jgi:hypothetical protein
MVEVPTRDEHGTLAARVDALSAELGAVRTRVARLEQGEPPPPPAPAPAGRIVRDGGRLLRNGVAYRFAGVNLEHAVGCGEQPGAQPTDAQADRFFAELGPDPKAVRIWVMPGISATWKANYRRIVEAAGRHGHYLIVTLLNGQPHCTSKQVTDYSTPNGRLPSWQAEWIGEVCGEHKGNPTIMAFELANEAREGDGNIGGWYGAGATLVRERHPGALVFTGGGHASNNADVIAGFVRRSEVDGFSLHDYYKPAGSLSPRTGIFNRAAELADVPWYMGERGFSIPVGGGGSSDQEVNAANLRKEYGLYRGGDPKTTRCFGVVYWDARFNQRESTTAYPLEYSGLHRAICEYRYA